MSGRSSRIKGAAAEREFNNLMNGLLGYTAFERNLEQTRDGGCDGKTELADAVEVKRQETLCLPAWIRQAREQAAAAGKRPVLAYRRNREEWTVLVIYTAEQYAQHLQQETSCQQS